MNSESKLIKSKLGLLQLAEQLGNVSTACKYLGVTGNDECSVFGIFRCSNFGIKPYSDFGINNTVLCEQ